MPLSKAYFVPKRSYPDQERIASVYLPADITDAQILTFCTAYEALTVMTQGDAVADTGARVWGLTQSVLDIQAKQNRNETQDLSESPYGINGYLFLNEATDPTWNCFRQQPINIEGLNPLFTIPAGYPPAGELQDQAAFFIKKWGTVTKRNEGVLVGLPAEGFETSKIYRMH